MSWFFLFIAGCLLLVGISAILSMMRLRVVPLPSSPIAVKKLIEELKEKTGDITEIGSGYGYMLFNLAKAFPERQIVGIEISFIPFLFSSIIRILGRFKNVRIYYGDAFKIIPKKNIKVDIAIAYLITGNKINKSLEELYYNRISKLLILNTYPLKNIPATRVTPRLDIFKSSLYFYEKKKS